MEMELHRGLYIRPVTNLVDIGRFMFIKITVRIYYVWSTLSVSRKFDILRLR